MSAAAASLSGDLLAALHETGAIGLTARQLASRLDHPPEPIAAALDALERSGDVVRMGRGLWMLREFERLDRHPEFTDPAEYTERFLDENGVSLGTYEGPITFRSNEAEPVHRWWPYVQGYSAEFVRGVLDANDLARGSTVLDPFAGSGTTLVEARRAGHRAWGVELLAPAVLAARVKTAFDLAPAALEAAGARFLASARRGTPSDLPFLRETRRQFDPDALRELLRLRAALPQEGRPAADAIRLAFGRILIPSSRLHRSPCLGYDRRRTRSGPAPSARFREAIATMAADLRDLRRERGTWGPPSRLDRTDARRFEARPESVDLALTSPPYVNGLDYVMNYKVDLAWLGYARSYADLAQLRSAEVACDNLPRTETAPYRGARRPPDPWLSAILGAIRRNLERKRSYRRDDMDAVVHRYFADLAQVIARVRDSLRPGGRLVLVVGDSLLAGTYVPGDLLLARIGAGLGLTIESVEIARTRRSGQRRSFGLRESVVTLRRPGAGR